MPQCSVVTQFGDLTLTQAGDYITKLDWGRARAEDSTDVLEEACRQIMAYDAGKLEVFDLPLKVEGSDFQRRPVPMVISQVRSACRRRPWAERAAATPSRSSSPATV